MEADKVAVQLMRDLIKVQAARASSKGIRVAPPGEAYARIAGRVAFELTPDKSKHKASYYGTWACLPAAFGLHAASVVLRALSVEGGGMNKKQRQLRKAAEYAAGAR